MDVDAITINNLTIPPAFNNFSIDIPKETLICISGPNNCGKTTLIRLLDRQIQSQNAIKLFNQNIETYKVQEHNNIIKTIIPTEYSFTYDTLEKEVTGVVENTNYSSLEDKMFYKELIKKLKLAKVLKSNLYQQDKKTIIKIQLLLALSTLPKILLLDDIFKSFNKEEKTYILTTLKEIQKEKNMTILITTSDLEESLFSDLLYIIDKSEVVLKGKPMNILQKDNILNRVGLKLPFMMDLSVKLRDYDLISDIELDMNRMVEALWK